MPCCPVCVLPVSKRCRQVVVCGQNKHIEKPRLPPPPSQSHMPLPSFSFLLSLISHVSEPKWEGVCRKGSRQVVACPMPKEDARDKR